MVSDRTRMARQTSDASFLSGCLQRGRARRDISIPTSYNLAFAVL